MERLDCIAHWSAISVIAVTVSLAMMAGANWIGRHSCCPITQEIARDRLGLAAPRPVAARPLPNTPAVRDAAPGDSP